MKEYRIYQLIVMRHWTYFNQGLGKTAIVKFFWLLFGFGSIMSGVNYLYSLYLGVAYSIFCYIFGWVFYNKGWNEAEIEVSNRINPFVKEMRKVYKV